MSRCARQRSVMRFAPVAIVSVGLSAFSALAANVPVAGKAIGIHNRPAPEDPTGRKITWSAYDANVVAGTPGSSDDPRCAGAGGGGGGGSIRFFSDRSASATEDTDDIALPCENWSALGSSAHPKGYAYRDPDQNDGPCKRVTVKPGKSVKATCSGKVSPLPYDLIPGVDQGRVATLLRIGAGNRLCTLFDDKNGRNGTDGKTFRGTNAAAPPACPVPFVCGDGIVVAGEQCDDGGTAPGDGCNAACQIEAGYQCAGEPSICTFVCGNGVLDPGEACDDGGVAPGDGCSEVCRTEPGYACSGEPSVCTAGCGDGVLGGSEACDDGNATAGDGCAADCRYEPLCLVTLDGGGPAQASVVKVSPDGSLAHVSDTVLPGSSSSSLSVVHCGRHVYMNLNGAVAGFDVGLDGVLTPLPTISTTFGNVARLACTPAGNLLFVFEAGVFFTGQISSYTVAPDGTLTLADSDGGGNPNEGRMFADFHPVTGDLYFAGSYVSSGPGPDIPQAYVARLTYDTAGNFSLAQSYYFSSGGFAPFALGGIRFTEDAGVLAVPGYREDGVACFGHYAAPGATLPPQADFNKTCALPFPGDFRAFVPRPEGGPLFYFQTGVGLHAAEFSGATVVSDTSIVPVHEASELLLAFGGRVLVSLSPVAAEVATYDVAPDLVTLTPNDTEPAPGPGGGLLLPCPGL